MQPKLGRRLFRPRLGHAGIARLDDKKRLPWPDVDETHDTEATSGGEVTDEGVTVRSTAAEAQANLFAVLQLCAAAKIRCSDKTRRPGIATLGEVAEALVAGDFYLLHPIASFAWPLLVQAGALAELAGGRLRLTARGRAALAAPAADTIRNLWRRWVSHAVLDEMSRIEEIKGQRSVGALTAAQPRRKAVATTLAACPPGQWVSIDELFSRIRGRQPQPTVARNPWKLYIGDPQYGSLGYDGFHRWSLLEGRYTLCVLFEYAGTLGLFDLAYTEPAGARDDYHDEWGTDGLDQLSRYDGLRAVRLNPLGAYALGLTQTYGPPADTNATGSALKVLPNLDIVITGETRPADRLVLDAYARRSSDRVWSLTADTLLAAVDTGRQLTELSRFLRDRTPHALPSTVTTLLADVTARSTRLRDLGVARLVACSDPALTTLITRDHKLRRLCSPVGDCHLAIPVTHEPDFRKALRSLGYVLPTGPES